MDAWGGSWGDSWGITWSLRSIKPKKGGGGRYNPAWTPEATAEAEDEIAIELAAMVVGYLVDEDYL